MEIIKPFSYLFATEVIKENLDELKKHDVHVSGNGQPIKNYKKQMDVLKLYPKVKKVLKSYIDSFLYECFEYNCKFDITTSWMTKLGVNESVHYHNHRNSFISGVFYFDEYTDKTCPLIFKNPIYETIPFQIGKYKSNLMCSDIAVKPEHNLLVLFPSWIYHYSNPNEEKVRRSLAFNVMPKGMFGDGDSTLIL